MDVPHKGTRVHFGEIEEEDAMNEGGNMIELNVPVGRNESGKEVTSGGDEREADQEAWMSNGRGEEASRAERRIDRIDGGN